MTPGLSLFYGGLVQSKNALNTVMQSMAAIVLVTFVWITVGFTISFGEGNLWFGNWEYTFLNHVGFATQEDISPHIPFCFVYVISNDVLYDCNFYFIWFNR